MALTCLTVWLIMSINAAIAVLAANYLGAKSDVNSHQE